MAFKIDPEWRHALSLLPQKEASKALEMIEEYRRTGTAPCGMSYNMKLIFLLVKPTLDRRRRASEAARRRRLEKRNTAPAKAPQQTEQHKDAPKERASFGSYHSEDSSYGDTFYGAEVSNLRASHKTDTEPIVSSGVAIWGGGF